MASEGSPDPLVEERAPPVDRPTFTSTLSAFTASRGISVENPIRVANKDIDLYRLYCLVVWRGGYDRVSAEKLAWRRLCLDFGISLASAAAFAFQLKTAYYKNLAAYEIKHVHGKEPPPVELLEDLTARGGDLLNRTWENYKPRNSMPNGVSESEDDELRAPKPETADGDDSMNGVRSSRGLRQQPAQRIIFQPDIGPQRAPRHSYGQGQSPGPQTQPLINPNYAYSPVHNTGNTSVSNWEPEPPKMLTLKPITTPGNNLAAFKSNLDRLQNAKKLALGLIKPPQNVMQPGAGYDGPNIYVRILLGLRCPLPDEQDYALHHLVKISHERGDKYRFDAFQGLAEGLVEYALKIRSVFFEGDWEISWDDENIDPNVLNGVHGTPDLLSRIASLERLPVLDVRSEEFEHRVTKVTEAVLTLRNLSLLTENSAYLARLSPLRDMLSILLNLPHVPQVTEMVQYALDIAGQTARYWIMAADDPLYTSLIRILELTTDRGSILATLHALCQISLDLEDQNDLDFVPLAVLRRLFIWLTLEDTELVLASLRFLYQFTGNVDNVALLLKHSADLQLGSLIDQLVHLIHVKSVSSLERTTISPALAAPPATEVPWAPAEMMEQLRQYEEPDRSNKWLKATYEEDPNASVTQIDIWHEYGNRFGEFTQQNMPLLPAADFIKNISQVFPGANAQVVNTGDKPKFIIKGLRPRRVPLDTQGQAYSRCRWMVHGGHQCREFLTSKRMVQHVIQTHLGVKRKEDGRFDVSPPMAGSGQRLDCHWAGCRHFSRKGIKTPTVVQLARHVRTHSPDISSKSSTHQRHNRTYVKGDGEWSKGASDRPLEGDRDQGREATYQYFLTQQSMTDEHGRPSGIPALACSLLRSLAKSVPRAAASSQVGDADRVRKQCFDKLFAPLRGRLNYILAHNSTLKGEIFSIICLLEAGERG